MAERRILIADADSETADDFRRVLGSAWIVVSANTGPAALAIMQKELCDVVVADLDLPELSGDQVLDLIRIAHPTVIRFIAASEAQKERAMCHVAGGCQFLAKPFDTATLKSTIARCLAADHCIINNTMRELIGRIRAFPTIPSLYLEVVNALNDPDATTAEVGAVVAKDMAMTTQLLQMLNSAYFSLPRTVTDPAEAVALLGFETVKSLVMSVKLRSQYDKVKPVYFSIDNVWRHSTNVARMAKELVLLESGDTGLAAEAFTAGLLHDLGKVILAANFDGQYSGAHVIARKNNLHLCEVETDIFGANHGSIASYLFGLWGMPAAVIEAAALHHYPFRSEDKTFSALTAVHVANALEREINPDPDGLLSPVIDITYLRELGLDHRVPDWRRALGLGAAPQSETSPAAAKSVSKSATSKPAVSKPKAVVPVESKAAASVRWKPRHWLLAGLGVAAAITLLCYVELMRLQHISEQGDQEPVSENAAPPSAPTAPAVPPTTVAPVVVAVAAPPPAVTEPLQVPATPTTVAPAEAVQPPLATPLSAGELAFNDLKLQGIFYTVGHPSAIINGQLTYVSQQLTNFSVLDISPTSVTVEYQNHRRVLTLNSP
jgi:HD-like signal output (HDOD) protein